MNVSELLRWQWEGYQRYHQSRANLMLHIVVVPLFLLGNVALVAGLVRGGWLLVLGGAACMLVSVALQGRGHASEPVASIPFTGPANAVARIFLEQWVTFPRYVLTGGWARALRAAGAPQ